MVDQGSMTKDAETARLRELAEQLKSADTFARALRFMMDNGVPTSCHQASLLRNSNAVEPLSKVLEPPSDVVQRNQAMHILQRMCRLDNVCQDFFIGHGAVRKLVKNLEAQPSSGVDSPAAVRAMACLVAGGHRPTVMAAIEDLFLSGAIQRLRTELVSRRKPDDLVASIGELFAALAAHPTAHGRLAEAMIPAALPSWIEAVGPGGGAATSFVQAAYQLSLTEAVAGAQMRNEAYFEALQRVISHTGALPNLRRTALLTLCNVFGGDADHVRAEEVLRTHAVLAMLVALLAAALGPADTGAAARAAAAAGAPTSASPPRRSAGGPSGVGQRSSENGLAAGSRASPAGDRGRRVSNGGGAGDAADGGLWGSQAQSMPGEPGGLGHHGRNGLGGALAGLLGRHRGGGGELAGRNGYAASSLTAPGAHTTVDGVARVSQTGDSGSGYDLSSPPMEAILHSLKCVAANSMLARKLARPGSPAYVLQYLLDAVVSSQEHLAAADITRVAWTARTAAAAQTLLRLASCAELVPSLRSGGALPVLRMLATETDDPRVSEAARGALLYMGDSGQVNHRAVAAAFRALYRNGASSAGSEPELGNRFQVFVSHHRADAHQFALYTLYPMLVMQGLPTFVDPQHRTVTSDWAHMIACCRNLVVVLSEMLLASPEHVREAEAAVQAGVQVVVVVPETCRWPDHHGNKVLDAPPSAVLDALPPRLRSVFGDKPLVYSSARHADFTQHLLARLRLPPPADGPGPDPVSSSPVRESAAMQRSSANGMGRTRGPGGRDGHDEGHRVSFTSEGELQLLQQQTADEAAAEAEAEAAAAGDESGAPEPHQLLPWPWNRLFDTAGQGIDDEEGGMVRYPRTSLGAASAAANGNSTTGESMSGSGGRMNSATMAAQQHVAAPPASGAPASYTSRRHAFRQRSSINRHAALQLQQQQQQWALQQQWVTEFHQQTQSLALAAGGGHGEQQGGAAGEGPAAVGGAGPGPGEGSTASMLNQLLALQLEMVRFELRQAVQASHETITHKIDRLRSDVTEQVVQLRFDLAGKIELLQEAITKATAAFTTPLDSAAAEAASSNGNGSTSGLDGGSASPTRRPPHQTQLQQHQQHQQLQQQQLAQALSASVTASLQEVVAKAVAQLQATVAAVAAPPAPGPLGPHAVLGPAGRSGTVAAGGHLLGGKGQQGAAAMLAAAAAQQQHHQPHPPQAQQGGHVRGSVVLAPQGQHLPPGVELSPVARAGAAAWSGDGTGGTHAGGAKSRTSHAQVGNGVPPAASGRGAAGTAGAAAGRTPGPLAMYDAVAATEDDAAYGTEVQRVMSPNALIASVTSPATAQAAILMAGRARQYGGGNGAVAAGGAGGSAKDRNGSAGSGNGTAAAGAISRPQGVNVLPPLAGLGAGPGGPLSPGSVAKLVERTEPQPVRKAQQQMLLQQQQAVQH